MSQSINFSELVQTMQNDLGIPVAIANHYGIILGSTLPTFKEGGVIPPKLQEMISDRQAIEREMELDPITNLVLETAQFHWVFTFGPRVVLITKFQQEVNFAQYFPVINNIVAKLGVDEGSTLQDFANYDFDKEFTHHEEAMKEITEKKRYKIMRALIKYRRK